MLLQFTAKPVQVWRPGTLSNIRRTPRLSAAKSQPGLARRQPRQLHLGWVCRYPFKGQYQAAGNDHANGPGKTGKYAAGGAGDIHALLSRPVERSSSSLVISEANQPQDRQRAPCNLEKAQEPLQGLEESQAAVAQRRNRADQRGPCFGAANPGVCSVQQRRSATRGSSRTGQLPLHRQP